LESEFKNKSKYLPELRFGTFFEITRTRRAGNFEKSAKAEWDRGAEFLNSKRVGTVIVDVVGSLLNRRVRGSEKKSDVWLQDRDIEILRFCLEMKFADLESLNAKFFDAKSQGMFAARKRIQKLEESGFLNSKPLQPGSAKKFYIATNKGLQAVRRHSQDLIVPKPVTSISAMTFEHDLGVLRTRLHLEQQLRATNWRGEQLLKAQIYAKTLSIARDVLPDAVFINKQGRVCAFEFENKPKSQDQLLAKISRLRAIMNQSAPVFEACLIVTSTEHLKNKVQSFLVHGDAYLFVVQAISEIQSGANKKELQNG